MFQRLSRLPWLWVILFVAFAVRGVAAVIVQKHVDHSGSLCLIAGDAEGYWMLAKHIRRGEDYALYDPPRYIERMPGFPLALAAGMKAFGGNVLKMRLMLAAVGTVACGLVYCLGRELFGRPVGLIACALAAVSPTFVVFSVLLLSETLFAAALLASLLAVAVLVRARRTETPPGIPAWPALIAVLAGALCGVATLVRPTWILVGPAVAVIYVIRAGHGQRRIINAGLLLAGLAAVLSPWVIRNARVAGHFVPTTLWVGPSLYDGLSPQATGDSNMQFVEDEGMYAVRDAPDFEYRADRHYRRAALDFVRRNPVRAIELGFVKLWRFANPFPNAAQFGQGIAWWGVGLFELPVLMLAAVGLWKARGSMWPVLLTAGPTLYFALVHAVFVGSIRYRLPAEYALLIVTAVGVQALAERRVRAT
ncbi:MAG: glycosyltransferase family 39 protein [Planctomycetia bacterium]|nr:glycosyltransferase family 39 protein [Planctomycetia bacterium]